MNHGTAEGGSRERSARSSAAAVSRDRASRARCRAARERALIWPGSSAALRWHASQGSRCSRSWAAVTAPLKSSSGRASGERACASQKCRNHTAALSGGTFLQEHQTADRTLVFSFDIEHQHPVFMLTVVGAARIRNPIPVYFNIGMIKQGDFLYTCRELANMRSSNTLREAAKERPSRSALSSTSLLLSRASMQDSASAASPTSGWQPHPPQLLLRRKYKEI